MSHSLSKISVHIIFHVKNDKITIRKKDRKELYAYMGSIIKDNQSIPIIINGVGNHVHILCIISKNIALAKLLEEIKRHSSRWIKTKDSYYTNFAWQTGYAGFSVSPSVLNRTKYYIMNQERHHNKISFKEEYVLFLQKHDIEYNEKYLWTD